VRSTRPQKRAEGANEEAARALPAQRREFEGSALISMEVAPMKMKVGVVGLGFIGAAHIEAIRRLGYAELVAACDVSKERGAELSIDNLYSDYRDLLNDPSINVIHNCTPNHVHYEINKMAIERGKHIFSEKPLSVTSGESQLLLDALKKSPVYNAVNFNYRAHENVRRMRENVLSGGIGVPYIVHGCYLQDWLLFNTDDNWRIDPSLGGVARALGDIGTHWCDLAQNIMNSRVTEVFADIVTFVPERGGKKVSSDDYAAVLLKFENGASGVFRVSQVSAGRKNFLDIEVNGSKRSLHWNVENCDKLWIGARDEENILCVRNSTSSKAGHAHITLPPGHAEGWSDGLRNNIAMFYGDIMEGKTGGGYATFKDGHDCMLIIDAIMKSGESKAWQKVLY